MKANITQRIFDSMAQHERVREDGSGGTYLTPLRWALKTPGVGCESARGVLYLLERSGAVVKRRVGRTFEYALKQSAVRPVDGRGSALRRAKQEAVNG